MKVCKFGGSSVADASQIKKVKAILDSDKERTIVVVSAPGKRFSGDEKVTDMLLSCAEMVQKGMSSKDKFEDVKNRYRDIAEGLGLGRDVIDEDLKAVYETIKSGAGRDYAASRGEHLNAKLIAKYLGWNYIETEECIVIGENNKIEGESYSNLASLIESGKKYVIPGFYGRSPSGDVRCFSRGGSDITGAIAARAVMADVYENWTDVSGVYSSDPRYVKSAHVITALSYKMVRELSEVGASVFHEEAIAPVVEVNIPINIRNTNSPDDAGTIIGKEPEEKGVVGVSAKGGLSKIYVRKLMFFKESGIRHKILSLMHIYGIKPCYTLYGCDSISWYFETKQIENIDTDEMCSRIKEEFSLDEIELKKGFAVVGLVGKGVEETMEYVDALDELRKNNIEPSSVSLGGSYTTFVIGVPEERKLDAVNCISERLFVSK
ncbi:MAG: aspartate kinase [Spirochaetales bacterium]|nr:aspartate kinase [Spirochaetales bacterium]